jgi:2-dehydropantoate 2-reductase
MRVGVVGAGGVGGYYGANLARAGAEVAFVARGEHLAAIREDGLTVRTEEGESTVHVAASDDPAEIGPCDAVLFCVKSYDTEEAAALLDPLLKAGTAVVSLQNGVDNEEKIAARIGAEHVVGGASFILAHIAAPGVVERTGSVQRVVFGELDGSRSARADELLAAFRAARVDADLTEDIRRVLWDKFAFLCALAGLTAVTRAPIDEILRVPESRELFRQMVGEGVAVARAEGVDLGDDVVDEKTAFAETLEPGSFSSLHHDLVSGRRLELDALHGELARRARRHGLSVPVTATVFGLLRPSELARTRAAGG